MHGVCLPGRESRFAEPFIVDDWKSLLKDFCQDAHGILKEKPFAFWGHRFVLCSLSQASNPFSMITIETVKLWLFKEVVLLGGI